MNSATAVKALSPNPWITREVPLWGFCLEYFTAAAKSLQSCPTLCDPIDSSPSGSPVPGILQARTLEWVAISFSNAWKWKVKVKSLSRVRLFATPWTAAYQAPLPMGFFRQAYWSGVPLPSLRIFHYLPLFLYFPPPLLVNHSVHSDGLLLMLWFSLFVWCHHFLFIFLYEDLVWLASVTMAK